MSLLELCNLENPFTDEYLEREVEFYGLKKGERGSVVVRTQTPCGRLDDYLNVNFRIDAPEAPVMLIDGKLWMSLTYMEVQSHAVPLWLASGRVATAGLGLGYFTLRAAASEDVDEVVVYERNEDVVEFFKHHFSEREGYDKIEFVVGDAREKMKGEYFDVAFVDIYPTLLSDEVLSDIDLFTGENDIDEYRFWGQELAIANGLFDYSLDVEISLQEREFFRLWMEAELDLGDRTTYKPSELTRNLAGQEFVENLLCQINRLL